MGVLVHGTLFNNIYNIYKFMIYVMAPRKDRVRKRPTALFADTLSGCLNHCGWLLLHTPITPTTPIVILSVQIWNRQCAGEYNFCCG